MNIMPLASAPTVHVFTDGSYDSSPSITQPSTSAWSILIHDAWLQENHSNIPSNEHRLLPIHVAGSTRFGAAITCTHGIYAAELQAIARALAMVPACVSLDVHVDSQSAIQAIHAYEQQCNDACRLRMAARPLLQLIHHLLAI